MTKTITNLPQAQLTKMIKNSFTLPSWVNYLAQDENGQWWGYEAEPNQAHNGWYENEVGEILKLELGLCNTDWQQSLIKLDKS